MDVTHYGVPLWRWTISEELRDLAILDVDHWVRQFELRMEAEARHFDKRMVMLEGRSSQAELDQMRRDNLHRRVQQLHLKKFILGLHYQRITSV